MNATRFIRAAALVLGAACASFADRGDLFLSLAPVVDAMTPSEPAFGGSVSLQLGANEATDFLFETDITAAKDSDADESRIESRFLIGSLYTPFFGEIRPRFGGSGGIVSVQAPGGINEAYFNLGFHLQGLYDVSDAVRLFAETHPNLTFGTHGSFSTLMKAGIIFRLSK